MMKFLLYKLKNVFFNFFNWLKLIIKNARVLKTFFYYFFSHLINKNYAFSAYKKNIFNKFIYV